eukprot:8625496-Pyramimonas_sp.AAC.1
MGTSLHCGIVLVLADVQRDRALHSRAAHEQVHPVLFLVMMPPAWSASTQASNEFGIACFGSFRIARGRPST